MKPLVVEANALLIAMHLFFFDVSLRSISLNLTGVRVLETKAGRLHDISDFCLREREREKGKHWMEKGEERERKNTS